MKKVFALGLICALASGCATQSKDIAAGYVSPLQYQAYDCDQLVSEQMRIQSRVIEIGGRLDQANANDKALVAGALFLWPTLFFLGGTKQQEAEYARLKGEHDAVSQAMIQKKCSKPVPVTPAAPVTPIAPSKPNETSNN